jgi:hypothetical protein
MTRPLIIARLAGGLGNQLFIYAAATALAQDRQARLKLDATLSFKYDGYRRHTAWTPFADPPPVLSCLPFSAAESAAPCAGS